MAMLTYLIAFGHFSSEWLIYRSASMNPGLLSPVIVSSQLFFRLLLNNADVLISHFIDLDVQSVHVLRQTIG